MKTEDARSLSAKAYLVLRVVTAARNEFLIFHKEMRKTFGVSVSIRALTVDGLRASRDEFLAAMALKISR